MPEQIAVRGFAAEDRAACVAIVRGSPEHFTPDVPKRVRRELTTTPTWVVTADGAVAGFAVVAQRFPGAAEIRWAAVATQRRGAGLGTALVERVLADLAADGVRMVEVKTLDPSAQYPPYVPTYAFWTARGFTQIDTIDPLPEWDPGSPAAILVTALG